MKVKLLIALFLTALIAITPNANAKKKVPLVDPLPISINSRLDIKTIDQAILGAMNEKGWVKKSFIEVLPREINAVFNIRRHTLTVNIRYDTKSIKIKYLDSTNLKYREERGERFIHDAYLKWSQELADQIKTNLAKGKEYIFTSQLKVLDAQHSPSPHFQSQHRLAQLIQSNEPITILVSDQRPYVLNGEKTRSFVALVRFFGAPISTNLKEGITAAQMIAGQVKVVLENAIPNSEAIGIVDNSTFQQIIDSKGISGKILMITVNEWKVDSPSGYGKTAFYYNLTAVVKNGTNETKFSRESKEIVQSMKLLEHDYSIAVESILSDASIVAALNSKGLAHSVKKKQNIEPVEAILPKPKENIDCSVSQVLKMKSIGLSDEQITKACSTL